MFVPPLTVNPALESFYTASAKRSFSEVENHRRAAQPQPFTCNFSIPTISTLFFLAIGETRRRSLSYPLQVHRYDQDADTVGDGKAWPAA
jgi:hypothetical protein